MKIGGRRTYVDKPQTVEEGPIFSGHFHSTQQPFRPAI